MAAPVPLPPQLDSCSICLEHVGDGGDRSVAKLKCGHHFHLDCIGSAFNAKGSMQCPNCRQVEDGQWLYGGSGSGIQDLEFESANLEEFLDLMEPEPPHVEWCPYQDLMAETEYFYNMLSSSSLQPMCPYMRHPRHVEEQLVVLQNPPSGGSVSASLRGPPTYVFHEVTGWSPHIPATPAVGTISDDDPSTLHIDRFRWAPANRSEAAQPGYNGQDRSPLNNSWHMPGPCPHYAAPSSRVISGGRRWSRHDAGLSTSTMDRAPFSALTASSFMDRVQLGAEASRPPSAHVNSRGRSFYSQGWYRHTQQPQHGQDPNFLYRTHHQQRDYDTDLSLHGHEQQHYLQHHHHRSSNGPWFTARSTDPAPLSTPVHLVQAMPQFFVYTPPDAPVDFRGHMNEQPPPR